MRLEARCHAKIVDLTKDHELLFQAALTHRGPVHLLLPQLMDVNLLKFKSVAEAEGVDLNILFAHKPTKCRIPHNRTQYDPTYRTPVLN